MGVVVELGIVQKLSKALPGISPLLHVHAPDVSVVGADEMMNGDGLVHSTGRLC